jgi:hypothetical protein
VLAGLPPAAVFYCCSTAYDGIKAVQLIESRRPDITLNPPVESLIDLVNRRDGNASQWYRPVYAWAPADQAVPRALTEYCRVIARGILWEIQPAEDSDGLVDDLRKQASAVRD